MVRQRIKENCYCKVCISRLKGDGENPSLIASDIIIIILQFLYSYMMSRPLMVPHLNPLVILTFWPMIHPFSELLVMTISSNFFRVIGRNDSIRSFSASACGKLILLGQN